MLGGRLVWTLALVLGLLVVPFADRSVTPAARAAGCAGPVDSGGLDCLVVQQLCGAQPAACTGPYSGVLVEGLTNAHFYSSPPPQIFCILPVTWVVSVTYAPASDVVSVSAAGATGIGQGGVAEVRFVDACWTQFTFMVTGTDVALVSQYTATVGQA